MPRSVFVFFSVLSFCLPPFWHHTQLDKAVKQQKEHKKKIEKEKAGLQDIQKEKEVGKGASGEAVRRQNDIAK